MSPTTASGSWEKARRQAHRRCSRSRRLARVYRLASTRKTIRVDSSSVDMAAPPSAACGHAALSTPITRRSEPSLSSTMVHSPLSDAVAASWPFAMAVAHAWMNCGARRGKRRDLER
eukprot:7334572-Prymnesium_polylepis.1